MRDDHTQVERFRTIGIHTIGSRLPRLDRLPADAQQVAHIGSWEIGSSLPLREEHVIHVVREEELDYRAQEFVQGILRHVGGPRYHTHFATRDPRLGITLLNALRRGEFVALQADRPRTGGRTIDVEIFQRPFALPLGPFALARSAEVALLPVFIFREGNTKGVGRVLRLGADPDHVEEEAGGGGGGGGTAGAVTASAARG